MDLDLELLASIASGGLGSWQQDATGRSVYVKSDDCIGCLRDLQRFFRHDDPEDRPAFFAVSKYNFARSDLVPLIVTYPDDYDVVYNALKVATFLTMPSSNPVVTTNRAQQDEHMQAVREAFLAQDALAAVVGMLGEPLAKHPRMDEKDAALVQLVMAFLRNLVAIPEASAGAGPLGMAAASKDARRRIQTGLLGRLFADNVMDLLLLLAQHAQQRPFRNEAPVLMETFMHIFCGVDPQQLLDAPQLLEKELEATRRQEAAARKAAERKAAAAAAQRQQQQAQRGGGAGGAAQRRPGAATTAHLPRLPVMAPTRPLSKASLALARGGMPKHLAQAAPSRHAHSGAVYVRRHVDHTANIVVRHNPNRSELPSLPAVVDAKKAVAQRKDGPSSTAGGAGAGASKPHMGAELLVRLDAFLQRFLDEGYDLLMGQVFKELEPGLNISRLTETDFLSFVRLATYCTRYVRMREERKLQAKLQRGAGADAGAGPAGGSQEGRQQGQAEADKRQEDEVSPFAAVSATMGWDCFHWVVMLWIMLSNMEGGGKQKDHSDKNWDLQHASVPLLKEMLLTLDLARVAGTAADRRAADRLQRRLLHDDLKESGLLPVLARLIKGYNFRFQPRSHGVDLIETLHVVLGMLDRLATSEPGGFKVKAAARRGGGGRRRKQAASPGSGGEDGDGGQGGDADGAPGADVAEDAELVERRAAVGRSGDPLEEDGEEEARPATREISFQAAHRVRAELAHPAVLHFYAWLLQGYRTNAAFTNHAVLALFRRVAEPHQLNLEPMLWQISILRLFEAMLSDAAIKLNPAFADLLAFAKRTVRNMFERMVPDLSGLEQQISGVEAELQSCAAAGGGGGGQGGAEEGEGEVDSGEQEKRRQLRKLQAELKARQVSSQGMFLEILFWKGASVAEDVRNEYNWRGLVDPEDHRRRGGRRGRGSALGDDEDDGEGGQRFFASYSGKQAFTEEQAATLRAEFERCNGHKDCLARLVFEFGGQWKKGQLSRQLKAMGLARGKFTDVQEEVLRSEYEEVRGKLDCFDLLADRLNAGFSAAQIKRHLRKIGVVAGVGRGEGGAKRKGAFTAEQEARLQELFEEHQSRADRFEKIAEDMGMDGLTGAKVKRQLRNMGLIARPLGKQKRNDAFDMLVAGSDDEEAGGQAASQQQSAGGSARGGGSGSGSDSGSSSSASGSDGSGSDSDGDSGFGSAKSDLEEEGGSAGGEGGGRAQARAARRLQALQALQKGKGAAKRQQQRARSASPELAGGVPLGPGGESDGEDGIEAQQAAAAGAASPGTSGGGRFVSLADSDAEEGEAVVAVAAAPASKRRRQQEQQVQGKKKGAVRQPSQPASDSEGEGGSSDGGFASARESDPDSEAEAPAAKRTKAGKKHSRQAAAAAPAEPIEQQGRQQSKTARRGQKQGGADGGGTPAGKRKAEQPAGPSSAQKRAALDALRRRRQQGGAAPGPAEQEEDGGVAQSGAADENRDSVQQEQGVGVAPAPGGGAKPGGRRLLKKGGGGAAAASTAPAPASLFEDLEDF